MTPHFEWTGYFELANYKSQSVEADSRADCEFALKAAIAAHYLSNPNLPVEDAWMNTPALAAVERDIEPKGVMTLRKLRKIREELGRDDVEITVGGIVFR